MTALLEFVDASLPSTKIALLCFIGATNRLRHPSPIGCRNMSGDSLSSMVSDVRLTIFFLYLTCNMMWYSIFRFLHPFIPQLHKGASEEQVALFLNAVGKICLTFNECNTHAQVYEFGSVKMYRFCLLLF